MINQIIKFKCNLKDLGNKYANALAISSKEIIKYSLKINKLKYLVSVLERNNNETYSFVNNNNSFNSDNEDNLLHVKTFPDNSTANFNSRWIGSFSYNNNLYAVATYPSELFFTDPSNFEFNRIAIYKLNLNKWEFVFNTTALIDFSNTNVFSNTSIIFSNGYIYLKSNNLIVKINFNENSLVYSNLGNTTNPYYSNSGVFTLSENNKELYVKDANNKLLIVLDSKTLLEKEQLALTNYTYKKIIYSETENALYFLNDTIIYKLDLSTNQETTFKTTLNLFLDLINYEDKVVIIETENHNGNCDLEVFKKIKINFYNKCNSQLYQSIDTTDYSFSDGINKIFFFNVFKESNYVVLYNNSTDSLGVKLSFKVFDFSNGKLLYKKYFINSNFIQTNQNVINNLYLNFNSNKISILNGTGGGGQFTNTYSQIISYKIKSCFCKTLNDLELTKLIGFTKKVIDK
jgi:hypothetical protein